MWEMEGCENVANAAIHASNSHIAFGGMRENGHYQFLHPPHFQILHIHLFTRYALGIKVLMRLLLARRGLGSQA